MSETVQTREQELREFIAAKEAEIAKIDEQIRENKVKLAEINEQLDAYDGTFGRQLTDLDNQITRQMASLVNEASGGSREGWKLVDKMTKARSELLARAVVYAATH